MFKAMVWKELREVVGVALLILVAFGLLVVTVEYPTRVPIVAQFVWARGLPWAIVPFVNDMFLGMYALVAAMAAIAVGLRQTLGESVRGTYLVLFHRPATRRSLIGTKLFVGVIVYLACAACPILAYGHWAAMPGHHASPFEWSMTLPSWIIGFDMTILYGGAFLSGIRQGRWFGTRLLPLIGTITILITVIANLSRVALGWPNGLVTIAINVCLLTAILFVAQNRDYS